MDFQKLLQLIDRTGELISEFNQLKARLSSKDPSKKQAGNALADSMAQPEAQLNELKERYQELQEEKTPIKKEATRKRPFMQSTSTGDPKWADAKYSSSSSSTSSSSNVSESPSSSHPAKKERREENKQDEKTEEESSVEVSDSSALSDLANTYRGL